MLRKGYRIIFLPVLAALYPVLSFKDRTLCTLQNFEPKSATKRLEDGSLVSPPLEDLAPFLPREEVLKNLLIDPVED